MKNPTMAILFALVMFLPTRADKNPELTYQGKPVSFWLDMLRTKHNQTPEQLQALKVFRDMGFKVALTVLHWEWRELQDGLFSDEEIYVIDCAFKQFSVQDKRKLADVLPTYLKEADPQVKASIVAMMPPQMLNRHFSKDEQIRLRNGAGGQRMALAMAYRESGNLPWWSDIVHEKRGPQ